MPRNYYKKVIVEYSCPNIGYRRILPRKIRFSRLAQGSVPRDQCPRDLCPRNMSIEYHPGYCPRNMSEVFFPGKHPQIIIARVMRPEFNCPGDLSRSKFPGIMSTAIPPRYMPGYFLSGGYFQQILAPETYPTCDTQEICSITQCPWHMPSGTCAV